MKIPNDLKCSKDHIWIRVEKNNTGVIGLTDHGSSQLGKLVYIEVNPIGMNLVVNETFGALSGVLGDLNLYMPISGKIIEFNKNLDLNSKGEPSIISADPYGKGWIIKVELGTNSTTELAELLDAKIYMQAVL